MSPGINFGEDAGFRRCRHVADVIHLLSQKHVDRVPFAAVRQAPRRDVRLPVDLKDLDSKNFFRRKSSAFGNVFTYLGGL